MAYRERKIIKWRPKYKEKIILCTIDTNEWTKTKGANERSIMNIRFHFSTKWTNINDLFLLQQPKGDNHNWNEMFNLKYLTQWKWNQLCKNKHENLNCRNRFATGEDKSKCKIKKNGANENKYFPPTIIW